MVDRTAAANGGRGSCRRQCCTGRVCVVALGGVVGKLELLGTSYRVLHEQTDIRHFFVLMCLYSMCFRHREGKVASNMIMCHM